MAGIKPKRCRPALLAPRSTSQFPESLNGVSGRVIDGLFLRQCARVIPEGSGGGVPTD